MAAQKEQSQNKERFSADSWYKKDIGPRLQPKERDFFESYSGVSPSALEKHLHIIRDKAWHLRKYPCIGQWQFLSSPIRQLDCYPEIIARLKAGGSLIDLGCCFGQELRAMAAAGAPTHNMYASDIDPQFWEMSYDLYLDQGRMKARFILADILNPPLEMKKLRGQLDVVVALHFFHLFTWDGQVKALKEVVLLSKPGTLLVGCQIGTTRPVGIKANVGSSGMTGAGSSNPFFHSLETFKELWLSVEQETNTQWNVDCSMLELAEFGMEKEDYQWMGPYARGLRFAATRKASSYL